ncbi:MAG: hypothetical protein U1F06_09485 [Steroidobacteraceae bacterium]
MSLPDELRELLAPAAYPHPAAAPQLVETPISWVLLTGAYAYKIKRPVRLEYLDQRTLRRRAELCAEELRLNRRFAPELYLGVRAIRRDAGHLRVDGDAGVDAVAPAGGADPLPARWSITPCACGSSTAARSSTGWWRPRPSAAGNSPPSAANSRRCTPASRPRRPEPWASAARVRDLVLANLEQCRHAAAAFGTTAQVDSLRAPLERVLGRDAELLAARRAAGRIRECHGDLHMRNIVRVDGRLRAFDCVEFEPAFRWIDVADDVAFLVADLEAQGAAPLALAFLQGWFEASGDWQAGRLLPLYRAHRALVRAKVAALSEGADAAARGAAAQPRRLSRARHRRARPAAAVPAADERPVRIRQDLARHAARAGARRAAPALRHRTQARRRPRAAPVLGLRARRRAVCAGRDSGGVPEARGPGRRRPRRRAWRDRRRHLPAGRGTQRAPRAGRGARGAIPRDPLCGAAGAAARPHQRAARNGRRRVGSRPRGARLAARARRARGFDERTVLVEADTSRPDVLDAVLARLRATGLGEPPR